ncbi:MAG TPA: TolC family protein [Candidatus Alistipes intestinigallinarum]|uniref:TolC family protein n=1 Tax=Candidatus Alistipes intestinigallinarum TaxID=2838440 RepID=A0A9D1Z0Z0_9BACT|nr:TolC family protein [Candidatus Alistipes intestinigallinarum]
MLTAAAQTATQSELQTAGEPSATGEVQTVPEDSKAETAPTPREIGDTTRDTTTLSKIWTLDECLRYALENNIQLRQSRNDYLSGIEDTKEAKAAMLPSLTASTMQGFTNYPSTNVSDRNTYTGTYGIDAGLTLYEGGKLRTTVKQQQLQNRIDELSVAESENDIRIAIVQAYLQALYAAEAVTVAANTAEVSQAQRDRAEELWKAGSISRVDFAQLESQLASDRYQVTVARTSLDNYRLQLKQLLELDITEEMNLAAPVIQESEVLSALPAKAAIYATALEAMPEIKRGELAVESAELGIRQAQAGFYPSVTLTAGIGTGHMSNGGYESGSQVWNRFNENVGLTLSIPIFSNRKNRTAVNKARLEAENSRLSWLDLQKTLLRDVESAYLDAVSAQSQYRAATEKERYARESFDLTQEQFNLGVKNTVELITAQNEWSSARQEVLQAKYMALLNIELLNIYQGRDTTTIN